MVENFFPHEVTILEFGDCLREMSICSSPVASVSCLTLQVMKKETFKLNLGNLLPNTSFAAEFSCRSDFCCLLWISQKIGDFLWHLNVVYENSCAVGCL